MNIKSYKVDIRAKGESSFVSNGIRLVTEEQAKAYGRDLFSRWMAVEDWHVTPSEDEPNHTADEQGRLTQFNKPLTVEDIMAVLNASQDVSAEVCAQIYKRLKALDGLISEMKYENETCSNDDNEGFAVRIMGSMTKAENVRDNLTSLPEEWKE